MVSVFGQDGRVSEVNVIVLATVGIVLVLSYRLLFQKYDCSASKQSVLISSVTSLASLTEVFFEIWNVTQTYGYEIC